MALARPAHPHPNLALAGWGDPAHVPVLSESVLALLRDGLGVGSATPAMNPGRIALPPARIDPSSVSAIVGTQHVCDDRDTRLAHTRGRSTIDLLRLRGDVAQTRAHGATPVGAAKASRARSPSGPRGLPRRAHERMVSDAGLTPQQSFAAPETTSRDSHKQEASSPESPRCTLVRIHRSVLGGTSDAGPASWGLDRRHGGTSGGSRHVRFGE